jgi:hypothetical protein
LIAFAVLHRLSYNRRREQVSQIGFPAPISRCRYVQRGDLDHVALRRTGEIRRAGGYERGRTLGSYLLQFITAPSGFGNVMIRQETSVGGQKSVSTHQVRGAVRGKLVSMNKLTSEIEAVYSEIESSIAANHEKLLCRDCLIQGSDAYRSWQAERDPPSAQAGGSEAGRPKMPPQAKRKLRRLDPLVSYGPRRPLSSHTWGRAAHTLGARKFTAQCRLGTHQS